MDFNNFLKYISTSTSSASVNDILWNDVQLLMRMDLESNAKGYPQYRDYSRYNYQVRSYTGNSANSQISYVANGTSGYPLMETTSEIDVDSFMVIPNKFNHSLRLSELNSGVYDGSTIAPTYLEVMQEGNPLFSFGTSDFTIEFSFYADELALPWGNSRQCIFSLGKTTYYASANANNIGTYLLADSLGYGCFLKGSNLYFQALGVEYKVNVGTLTKLKWYHICIQRTGNTLKTYVDKVLANSYSFSTNLSYSLATNADTRQYRLNIGADTRTLLRFQSTESFKNSIDTSFSGGLSNLRITKKSRYSQSFYSLKLPFPLQANQNKLDSLYNDVMFNFPCNYDLFDYSKHLAHIEDKELLYKTFINFNTGYLNLDGNNKYLSIPISTDYLSSSEWTLEFYLCLFRNGVTDNTRFNSFHDAFSTYQVPTVNANATIHENYPFVKLIGDGNKNIFEVGLSLHNTFQNNFANYMYFSASTDGTNYLSFSEEANININRNSGIFEVPYTLPNTQIKFAYDGNKSLADLIPEYKSGLPTAYEEPNLHIAISRYNSNLNIFINGNLHKTIPFNFTLYQPGTNCQLQLGGLFLELLGRKILSTGNETARLSYGIKGVRLTNKARYNVAVTNTFTYDHSLHPFPNALNKYNPPRARILAISKANLSPSVSTDEVEWLVYLAQPVDNLVLADFTLSQLEGVTGASLTSITKNSNYEYSIKADSGTGNGKLGLNFIDRKTVYYKDTTTFISNEVGELSFEGEFYIINKSAPVPILTSGSSPYVNGQFTVNLKFDSAIATFNPEKIGVINGIISNIRLIDDILNIYEFDVTPVKQDPVIVQCLEGCGVTDTAIISSKSNVLTRIYSDSFPILQTPLNITNSIADLSPTRLQLSEVIDNNTVFSNTISPLGENSSLHVKPQLEQSGLKFNDFNAVNSTFSSYSISDWTIEFFLRVNSSGNKTTHIFSIEDPNTGICIVAKNGKLIIQRKIDNTANLFPGVEITEIDTPSYVDFTNTTYSTVEKYPHFAITKKGNVYRFYRNGVRVALISSSTNIDITKGDIFIGYYPNRISDQEYYLSNLKVTLGKALYTGYQVNIPSLPYTVLPNITDETSLLSYISIYSNNSDATKAKENDKIILYFNSIIELSNLPTVTILGREADLIQGQYNTFTASVNVEDGDIEGEVPFSILVHSELGIPESTFTSTTNGSKVFIDLTDLTASITTDVPNDDRYELECFITFSEPVLGFSLDKLTLTNCRVSNLIKYAIDNTYKFTMTANSTGLASVQLLANKVTDSVGNYNLVSNVFSRNCTVPAYVPDANWDNVLLLLQPTSSIVDESDFNHSISSNNVSVVNTTSPSGLTTAMFFNGTDSSLSVSLDQSLPGSMDYTIEFFMYVSSNSVFRLSRPSTLPASDVTTNSFKVQWEDVDNATSYVLDVAEDSNFSTFVPGFKQLNVGNNTNFDVQSSDLLSGTPESKKASIIASGGFVAAWSGRKDVLGYRLDVALDDDFDNKLYSYSNRFTTVPNFTVGNIKNAQLVSVSDDEDPLQDTIYSGANGVVLTGLVGNASYPKLMYFLEESSIRLYRNNGYGLPAIAEDIDPYTWMHVAVVNTTKYTYLYVNGELKDRIKNASFNTNLDIGYSIGGFYGYLTGLRITKGVARYSGTMYSIPKLPYSKN